MAIDLALVLDQDYVVAADENRPYIEVPGGILCWAGLHTGAMSGGSTTFDVRVQASPDGGSNYYMIGKFQQLGPSDDSKILRIPVYVPQPEDPDVPVRVRLNYDVAGASPSYAVALAYLDPMVDVSPPAIDEELEQGCAVQISAV